MRGRRALSGIPFDDRIGINLTILAGCYLKYLTAVTARIYDSMTAASIEAAAFFRHEAAIQSILDGYTNHDGNHLRLFLFLFFLDP